MGCKSRNSDRPARCGYYFPEQSHLVRTPAQWARHSAVPHLRCSYHVSDRPGITPGLIDRRPLGPPAGACLSGDKGCRFHTPGNRLMRTSARHKSPFREPGRTAGGGDFPRGSCATRNQSSA